MRLEYHSDTYYSHVRAFEASHDLDLMRGLHPQALPPTQFYDGATHIRYLKPSRLWENWFCSSEFGEETPDCKEFLKSWYDRSKHGYKTVVLPDPVKGRSLHAAEDIPKGSFINADDTHMHLHVDAHQWEALNQFIEDFPEAKLYKDLRNFFITYGFENEPIGLSGWSVSVASNNTFTNHGCSEDVRNVKAFPVTNGDAVDFNFFNIVLTRRPQLAMSTGAVRDIKKGEEITMDYAAFRTYPERKYTDFLNGICNTGVGLVDASDGHSLDSCIDNNTCF